STPLAADADALDETQGGQDDRPPYADNFIGRHKTNQESRNAHEHDGRDQRRFAADAVAIMTENGGANWACHEPHGNDSERFESASQRFRSRKEQPGEDEARYNAVEEKIIPFDCGPDSACDNRPRELLLMLGLGKWRPRAPFGL